MDAFLLRRLSIDIDFFFIKKQSFLQTVYFLHKMPPKYDVARRGSQSGIYAVADARRVRVLVSRRTHCSLSLLIIYFTADLSRFEQVWRPKFDDESASCSLGVNVLNVDVHSNLFQRLF